ncbi:nucleotidyl transferase AbiEii/AbiGii toxin family protein [Actinoplanes subglobosus]|uniref:Nucleotidyl transferase AbiEii/AbiGii toxin family protein n=1 Tax=Actinoplanes subglobosus TaxID=1547892 RepID=A0ABV8IP21_9ACTN
MSSHHRSALDHVLTLIAGSHWADILVLRGSMTMPAWVGDVARPPGDLDFMVWQPPVVPDDLDPYPYVDAPSFVQQWPEAAHRAIRNEIWEFEEFGTGGHHPRLPPEGLHWVAAEDLDTGPWEEIEDDFAKLLADSPWSADGIVFDHNSVEVSTDLDYADYEPGGATGRIRLTVPWRAEDFEVGSVQVDLAWGERLPEPAICTAVPRAGGLPPVAMWTASRELSLAWKLHWLAADQKTNGVSAMKDLYDAVLLAELDGMHLRPRLRRLALGAESTLLRSMLDLTPSSEYTTGVPSFAPPPKVLAVVGPAPLAGPCPAEPDLPFARVLAPETIPTWRVLGTPPPDSSPTTWLTRLATAVTHLL